MNWRAPVVIGLSLVVGGLLGTLVFAQFTDTQTASGGVNATSTSVDLYICEASDSVAGPPCAADDSGGDEIIFEGLEDLIPGQVAEWDIRLVNQGPNPWDILDVSPSVTIASDPGDDCGTQLNGDPTFGFVAVLPKQGIGGFPKAIAVNPSTNRIYISTMDGLSVVDRISNSLITTLALGDTKGVAVNPNTNRVYVTSGSFLKVIDGFTNAEIAQIGGVLGSHLAVNPTTNRIYAHSSNTDVAVIDGGTNTVIATVQVGSGQIGGIAVNSATNLVYVTNQISDTVSVVDGSTNTKIATVPVGSIPGSVGANPATNRIYVKNGNADTVSVIDGGTNLVVATINGVFVAEGSESNGLGVNPTTNRIYVTDKNGNKVSVIDGGTNTVMAAISLDGPRILAVDSNADKIYADERRVGLSIENESLVTIDGASNEVIATISAAGADNDNHNPLLGFPTLPRIDSGSALSVHVGPEDYEDIRIFVMLPNTAPSGCEDAAWEVSILWDAQIHSP